MKVAFLSVFFPAYNEEKNIKQVVTEAIKILEKIASKFEIIVIDDGSTDKTGAIVKRLITKEKRISLVTHTPNRGYGAALKSGFAHSQYPWIAYTDADGQFDFKEIKKFIAKRNEADLIIGYRLVRRDPASRRLIAKLLQLWNFLFFGLWVRDVDCGFKLIKKEVIDKIGNLATEGGMIETELLVRAKRAGFKIMEVPVHHYRRPAGRQTGADPKVILKAIKETFPLWLALRNS